MQRRPEAATSLDTTTTGDLKSLTGNVGSKGRSKEEDRGGGLLNRTWPAERNVSNSSDRLLLVVTSRTAGNTESDLLAVDLDSSTGLLSLGETSVDPAESDGVGADAERTPLLADGLGDTKDGRLGSRVVDLADVAVDTRGGGDIDDGHVLALVLVLDAEVGSSSTDDAEGSGDVAVEHELESSVIGGVSHLVGGETGIVDNDVELAPLVDGSLDYALAKVGVHDVTGESDGRATSLVDGVGHILGLLAFEIRNNDVSAVAGEELGGGLTDTLTSTGDDGDLALEEWLGCKYGKSIVPSGERKRQESARCTKEWNG